MKHEFTDAQLEAALSYACRQNDGLELIELRDILDALPEPQDDWQDVTDIRQIRRGDMLKNQTENALITYKYAVKRVELSDGVIHFDNDEVVFWYDNHTYYRIPAPVTHPDPDKDLVILDGDGSIWFRSGYGDEYHSPTDLTYFKHPTDFTDWSPAKVVADDE